MSVITNISYKLSSRCLGSVILTHTRACEAVGAWALDEVSPVLNPDEVDLAHVVDA